MRSWKGDSKDGGHQDIWIRFDVRVAAKLEAAREAKTLQCKLDEDRYVGMERLPYRRRRC